MISKTDLEFRNNPPENPTVYEFLRVDLEFEKKITTNNFSILRLGKRSTSPAISGCQIGRANDPDWPMNGYF
jgi:hypothetical protein